MNTGTESVAVIDGDIVAYRCAATAENDSEHIAKYRADDMLERILSQTAAQGFEIYLSGGDNFRKRLCPDYKANREGKPRPKWLEHCREHLVREWGSRITAGHEADDELAMASVRLGDRGIICSIDKDLYQIPGRHYNFVKEEWREITQSEGLYNFYWHVLVGDSADNIKGARGIGPKKATRLLSSCDTDSLFFNLCRGAFGDDYNYILTGTLIHLWRKPLDLWNPPALQMVDELRGHHLRLEQALLSGYTAMTGAEAIPSTEPTGQESSGSLALGRNPDSSKTETSPAPWI